MSVAHLTLKCQDKVQEAEKEAQSGGRGNPMKPDSLNIYLFNGPLTM